nr:transmembrane emp24 domain-containing protein p24beta2-like isoform X2 [Physcomitrium patens]|eukprot:XP_024382413.1 transmembrane emp24 domain-containing protein p24beta2-like isoform X2 [Physcomitrella patens]
MKNNSWDHWRWLSVLGLMWLKSAEGIRFDLEHRECLMHEAEADGEFVHMFVKVAEELNPPPFRHIGVDVVIQSPGGHFIHTEKLKHQSQVHAGLLPWEFGSTINFTAVEKGRYKICFHNRGSWVETVILDMLHPDADYQEPVKDEHIQSLMKQIRDLSDSLLDVELEQDWLASHFNLHATSSSW